MSDLVGNHIAGFSTRWLISRCDFLFFFLVVIKVMIFFMINPYLMNGFSHHYHLGESTFMFRGVRSDLEFLSHFSMKFP